MPNVAAILKEEIVRLARREIKREHAGTRKQVTRHRREIAELKAQVAALSRELATARRRAVAASAKSAVAGEATETRVRFSAKGLQSMRSRLGLSAAELGQLIGVSAQSVYNWEHEHSTPRASQLGNLAALRGVGKREAKARLEALAAAKPAPARRARRKG